MRKNLLTSIILLLCCINGIMAQSIVATPRAQTIACSGIATINVNSNGENYFATVNGGLAISDNGQNKTLLITNQSAITVRSVSGPGKVYVALANNTAVVDSVSVNITPIALGAISGSVCLSSSGTATYSVPAQPGVSYLWRIGGGGGARIVSGANTSEVTIESIGTATSWLRVYAFNDCTEDLCAAPNRFMWIRKSFPVAEGDLTGAECMDFSVLGNDSMVVLAVKPYLASASLNDYGWQYTSGLKRIYTSADGSAISFKITDATVDQTVQVTPGKTCNPTNTLTKVLKAPPPIPVLVQDSYCFPSNQTTATFTIDPAYHKPDYTYHWELPLNWSIISSTETSVTAAMDAFAGNVTVRASSAICGDTPKTFTVNRNMGTGAIAGTSCIAYGAVQPLTYTITPTNNSIYTWTLPPGWEFQDSNNQHASTVTVIPDGIHGGVLAAVQECGFGTEMNIFIDPQTPSAISGPICVQYNATAVYTIAAVPDAMGYEWQVPAGWAYTTSNGERTITVTGGIQSNATVRVRAKGCGSIASIFRELNVAVGPPTPSAITGPTCVAQNADGVVYTVPATPNATGGYEWQAPAGWVYSTSPDGRTITVNGGITANGNLSVRAKGCGSIVSGYTTQAITVGPGTPAAFTTAPTCVAPGSTGVVYTIPALTGASSYDWVVPNGWTFTGNGSRSITVTSPINSGGTVRVRGIGCNGTTGPPRDVVVTVTPAQPGAITYYVGTPGNTCIGQGSNVAVSLSVPEVLNATSYIWTIPSGWSATNLTTTTPITLCLQVHPQVAWLR